MNSTFWNSDLGQLTGNAEDAFTRTFKKIPDGTTAIARIKEFVHKSYNGNKYLQIDWLLIDGEFAGQHVFQKLHVFDADNKRRHKALNMLMLLYKMYGLKPLTSEAPTDSELNIFVGKEGGLRIQETVPNENGKTTNWVSEVHPKAGFECKTGVSQIVSRTVTMNNSDILDDLPF